MTTVLPTNGQKLKIYCHISPRIQGTSRVMGPPLAASIKMVSVQPLDPAIPFSILQ